ncbi:hypothetical protein L1987_87351 [Smallanthus sonchifolius]|nr:hypothetical protein L1987_87351 [Smallanthus sonchifolius]
MKIEIVRNCIVPMDEQTQTTLVRCVMIYCVDHYKGVRKNEAKVSYYGSLTLILLINSVQAVKGTVLQYGRF